MAVVYRLMVVVDVLDGSTHREAVEDIQRRYGPVVGWGLIGENSAPVSYENGGTEGEIQDAPGIGARALDGPRGPRVDA